MSSGNELREQPLKERLRKRKQHPSTPSHEENSSAQNSRVNRKKQPPTTTKSASTDDTKDVLTPFNPDQWTLFGRAHRMVEVLVNSDDAHPYRKKLLDLAQHSIEEMRVNTVKNPPQTPADVIAAAWEDICFIWADPSTDSNLSEDGAYTSMGKDGDRNFSTIGISSSFKENDAPTAGQEMNDGDPPELTKDEKRTLLFFFRKIKHEFLHVVHRFLCIKYKQRFAAHCFPEKYTPHYQRKRGKAVAEVGDHDEEEDSGGPILPFRNDQKLSNANPLCLFFLGKYLPLKDEHVEGLLEGALYATEVDDERHDEFIFSCKESRAVVKGVLKTDFFRGDGLEDNRPSSSKTVWKSSLAASSRASSAKGTETDDYDDTLEDLAAWRRCKIAIAVRRSCSHKIKYRSE